MSRSPGCQLDVLEIDALFNDLADDLEIISDDSFGIWKAVEKVITRVLGPNLGPSESWLHPTWKLGDDAYLFTVDIDEFTVIGSDRLHGSSSGSYHELDTIHGLDDLRDFLKDFVCIKSRRENPSGRHQQDDDGYFVLQPSSRPKKKWMVRVPSVSSRGRTIHFGDASMEDFTMHRDVERRKAYRSRHRRDNIEDPYYPGFWSWHVLWGEQSDIKSSFEQAVRIARRQLERLAMRQG